MISMCRRPIAALARLLPLLLLVVIADASADVPISFRTTGGDAWTFEKETEGTVAPGLCDLVAVSSPLGIALVHPQGDGFVARVPVGSGENRLDAECLKNGGRVAAAAPQTWHVRLPDVPKARIRLMVAHESIQLDGGDSEVAPRSAAPIMRYEWRAPPGNPTQVTLPAEEQRLTLLQAWADGEHRITLKVTDAAGRTDESTAIFRVTNGKPEVFDRKLRRPDWIGRAIIYGIVPALFGRNGLKDVTRHLDRLAVLGVNTLWLIPVTKTSPGDFGYAVTDHFRLRTDFGSDDDLHELIAAAHTRNMRVILDFVPNHVSDRHDYFSHSVAHSGASPYFGFFERTPAGEAVNYFDWGNLKNLNFDHPEVQGMMIEAFSYWVREFDVDGFRVDVAWGLRQRAPDFWPRWHAELRRIKPDLLLLAEASARDSYYFENGFDAAYDWTDKLGQWAWHDAFDDERKSATRLRTALSDVPSKGLVFRFINNNDTGPRFISRYGLARTKVAAAMLLTLPGLPSLFTGQEIGAEYEPYKTNDPLVWDDPDGLASWYTRLIALRAGNPQLRSSVTRFLDVGASERILAFERACPNRSAPLIILLNFGATSERLSLRQHMVGDNPKAFDLLSGEGLSNDATGEFIIGAYETRIVTTQETTGRGENCH